MVARERSRKLTSLVGGPLVAAAGWLCSLAPFRAAQFPAQTIARSAPRNRTACEKATKCGVGQVIRITYCSHNGMLSIGVAVPDRSCMTRRMGIASSANWPRVVVCVASRMPSGDREGVESGPREKEGQRAGDWNLEQRLDDERERQAGGDQDDEAVGDDLRKHDLRRHHRHDQQMLAGRLKKSSHLRISASASLPHGTAKSTCSTACVAGCLHVRAARTTQDFALGRFRRVIFGD